MTKTQIYVITICLLLLLPEPSLAAQQILHQTFTGLYPANTYDLGTLTATTHLRVVLVQTKVLHNPGPFFGNIRLFKLSTRRYININQYIVTPNAQTVVLDMQIDSSGVYWVVTETGFQIVEYTVQIYVNGALVKQDSAISVSLLRIPVHKITITNQCKMRIVFQNVRESQVLMSLVDNNFSPVASTEKPELVYEFTSPGDYYLEFSYPDSLILKPYVIHLYTYCDRYCLNPAFPNYVPPCFTCGNGILEDKEQCDNGNKPGCSGCIVADGYECIGNLGSTSNCFKFPVCGDNVVDQGEECDNGNRLGCSSNCKFDTGYKCVAQVGSPSLCSFCGNSIVEPGEECDNRNLIGCSTGCKVDAGFDCRGVSSTCFRKNPVCGNKIIEIGEACDDGNTVDGDGCNQFCVVEEGYTCTGQLTKSSHCQLNSNPSTCGNSIYEPTAGEQCDNGNKAGCLSCVVQRDWDCENRAGVASICLPRVVIPHCGNGVFEPTTGEVCDDGNVINGDGCSSFCQIEFGWVCIGNTKCVNLQDPQLRNNCGNGIVERSFGEDCDDGNKVGADGCSASCKVEPRWTCGVLNIMGNRSVCSRGSSASSFICGNGIVEQGETCDDGFPLKGQDGCSTSCQIEPGWNCQQSRCWRI